VSRRHLYFYTYIPRPFDTVEAVFTDDPARWLPPPATGENGCWRVGLQAPQVLPERMAHHPALVDVGAASRHASGLLRAISWRSAQSTKLVPVLDADLELSPLSDRVCQLSLMGVYRPPLSVIGDAADRVVGHRVAEACVRDFVLEVAAKLEAVTLPV
jgi:hypothetical protein